MKAKEAAEKATKDMSCEDVIAIMPKYSHDLPKRQWLSTFIKSIPYDLQEHFNPLKKLAYPKQFK
jgi:hypothetical protein